MDDHGVPMVSIAAWRLQKWCDQLRRIERKMKMERAAWICAVAALAFALAIQTSRP